VRSDANSFARLACTDTPIASVCQSRRTTAAARSPSPRARWALARRRTPAGVRAPSARSATVSSGDGDRRASASSARARTSPREGQSAARAAKSVTIANVSEGGPARTT